MTWTRPLNPEFELAVRDNGVRGELHEARGDVIKKGTAAAVATVFGPSLAAAEDAVWLKAQEWLGKRRRSRSSGGAPFGG
jgi:hypothetical protein